MGDASYRRLLRMCAAPALALFCALCGWRTLRLALAPDPGDAEYHFGIWENGNAAAELDAALALNPRYAAAWIARGLAAETGDRKSAEASLLRAAAVDNTYLPRWTLANFYLRGGDMTQFWNWARRAAAMTPDPSALFQLCWRASGDAREILDRAIPPSRRRAYFDFLLSSDRWDAAAPLAEEILRAPEPSDVDRLLRYADISLAHKRTAPARQVWKALGRGLDWRPSRIEGARISVDPAQGRLSVALSGRQPETCDLVEQYAFVDPGAVYRLRFSYLTNDLPASTGLSWSFVDAGSGAEFASDEVGVQTISFRVPPQCDLVRIILRYKRPAGAVRAEGEAVFSGFRLERL